jgi:large subunit ribosomal protein L14
MSVFVKSVFSVIDNSGATKARCVEIYNSSKYYGACVGAILLVSLQKVLPNRKIKKKDLVKALVVRTKNKLFRSGCHVLILSEK